MVLTEIMYNDPGANADKMEFLEFYNNDTAAINLLGYTLFGVTYTFPDTIVQPNNFIVVAAAKDSFVDFFGFTPLQWTSGTLLNAGETIKLLSPTGATVDSVTYSSVVSSGWTVRPNGNGPSLILCNANADNSLAASWDTSSHYVAVYATKNMYASPGMAESCGGDIIPPMVISAVALNPTTIEVIFSEDVDATALNTTNYAISLGVSSVTLMATDKVNLTLTTPLQAGILENLTIDNVADMAGNQMATAQTFVVGLAATGGDLVITEIMYNDAGSNTDRLEFIEIYNKGTDTVAMWNYSLGGVLYYFPDTLLLPNQYITVAFDKDSFATAFGFTPLEWLSGNLSNLGEKITLFDGGGNILDSLTYGFNGAWTTLANGQGYSLMLCDPNSDNSLPQSWNPSANYVGVYANVALYASPNAGENCPAGDTIPPIFTHAYFKNPSTIVGIFNETVDNSAINAANYTLNPTLNVSGITFGLSADSVYFALSSPATYCVNYTLTAANIADIAGNTMQTPQNHIISICPDFGKIAISEIMYNNFGPDSLEFVELYNADTKPINLNGFYFSSGINYTFGDTTLQAGDYLVIAAKPFSFSTVFGFSPFKFTGTLLNTGEGITLRNSVGLLVDTVFYKATAPFPNQPNGNGPSLVLCNALLDNMQGSNWSAATEFAGVFANDSVFATPGMKCSGAAAPIYALNDTTLCGTSGVLDAGNAGSNFLWNTGDTTQTINITNAGTYNVLINNGVSVIIDSVTVNFAAYPTIDTVTIDPFNNMYNAYCVGYPLDFTVNTTGATSWSWDFGDGSTATTQNPTHTYMTINTFTLSLTVSNGICEEVYTKDMKVDVCSRIENEWANSQLEIYPNPASDKLLIHLKLAKNEEISVSLEDVMGRVIRAEKWQNATSHQKVWEVNSLTKGIYFLHLTKNGSEKVVKLIVD